MIKELNDLIHLVKTSVWRDEELLEFFTKNNSELLALYRAIWANSCLSDAAAARAAGIGLTCYKKQARALRNQLRQLSVFFDHEKARADVSVKNQVEGALEVALLQVLQTRNYRHAPLEVAKRLYRRGQDYELPGFVVEALRVLKTAAANDIGSAKQFETYAREYWRFRSYADAEEQALDCFQSIQLPRLAGKKEQQHYLDALKTRLNSLEPFAEKIPSRQFHVYYFLVQGYYSVETGDYTGALSCYESAIAHFRSKSYPAAIPLAVFFYSKVPACILLGRYAEGETAVLASLDYAPNGSFNFFKAYELYFSLAIHAGHYAQALEIYQTATLHKRFGNLPALQQEYWRVLGAYLFIFYRLNNWAIPEKTLPVFRSVRLANETAHCTQDKTGWNVAVQLALALLQLVEGREDELLDKIQALDKYRIRYLQDCGADRSDLFIRMLAQLPKAHFQGPLFLNRIQNLLNRLKVLPPRLTNQHCEVEIIPYEILAPLIARYLSSNHRTNP